MAVPSLPAQGSSSWFSWAQGLHNEVAIGSYKRVPVLARAMPPLVGGLSDGTKQGRLYRTRHKVMSDAHSLRVAYSNYYNDPGSGLGSIEKDNPDSITVYAACEATENGPVVPITPSGGVTLLPGQTLWFELPYEVYVGQDVYFRTQVAVSSLGKKWPLGPHLYMGNEGIIDTTGAPSTDVTISTAAGGGGFTYVNENGYGPSAVIGTVEKPRSSVLIVGDSIAWGVGGDQGEVGFINGVLIDNNICHQQIAMSSSTAQKFTQANERYRRMALGQQVYYSHVIFEYLTNDLGFGSGVQANAVSCWQVLARHGAKVWATTGLPHTTDSAGQIPASSESTRTAYNDWLRGGAPLNSSTLAPVAVGTGGALLAGQAGHPLAGYLEAADLVETARNSGKWQTGTTGDGLHPTVSGHTALRAAVNLTQMGIS